MNIEIINIRKEKPSKPYDFYVDRRSPVGNPFPMTPTRTRNDVCDEYAKWLQDKVKNHDPTTLIYLNKIVEALIEYGHVRLFCWCAPKRCHAETVVEAVQHLAAFREVMMVHMEMASEATQ